MQGNSIVLSTVVLASMAVMLRIAAAEEVSPVNIGSRLVLCGDSTHIDTMKGME